MSEGAARGGNDNGTFNGTSGNCPANDKLPIEHMVAQMVLGLLSVVGLLGNSITIYFCMRVTNMQMAVNTYILNLAIADCFVSISIPVVIIILQFGFWPLGIYMCNVYMISTGINQFTSSIFICIMSGDRYIAVCHPIAARRMRTQLVSRLVSAAAWTFSTLVMTPILIYITLTQNVSSCHIGWPEPEFINGHAFMLYFFAFGFVAPFFLILTFYYLIINKLKTVGPNRDSNRFRRTTKLVLTVIVLYMLCWMPYWVFHMVLLFSPPVECASRTTVAMFLVVTCLSYTNSALNPILYAFQHKNFRKSFLMMFPWAAGEDVGTGGQRAGEEGEGGGVALQTAPPRRCRELGF